jgi:hypothetical protein
MIEWIELAVKPHWPFIMASLVFMIVGQVMKGSVFTRARAYAQYLDQLPKYASYLPGQPRVRRKYRKMWWWAYKTLPLHPVVTGILLGLVIREPEPGISGYAASLYFAGAGTLSVFLYEVIKGLAKRQDIELPMLPGQSAADALLPYSSPLPAPPKVPADLLEPEERPTNPIRRGA